MPTIGPWNEGRIHEEIIHAKISVDYDPPIVHELLSPEPTRRSGWTVTTDGWFVNAAATWEHLGGLSEPPPPRPEKSEEAFVAAMGSPVIESGWNLQYDMTSNGGANPISVGVWSAQHGWEFRGTEYRMGYGFINDMSARYAVPPGMDHSTSEYTVQLEPWVNGEGADIELLSAIVLGPGDMGDYGLFCKDAGTGEMFLNHGPASVSGSQINQAPFDLTTPIMADIMEEIRVNGALDDPVVDTSTNHPSMPRMSWLYTGSTISDPHFDGNRLVSHVEGMGVAIKITYKMPRWRQYFFDDTTLGRLKVNAGTEDFPTWKFMAPQPGENSGVGVGKVNVGTEVNPIWRRLAAPGTGRMKINVGIEGNPIWVEIN